MIVADRKSLEEILAMVADNKKILIVGCKGCVTVCNVGGLKEVEILTASMKIARKKAGKELLKRQIAHNEDKMDGLTRMVSRISPTSFQGGLN
jgi:ferredoxin